MAGATTLGDLASAIGVRSQEEAAIVAELKAGSEAAYAWLIGEFQQPVYGLVYRVVNDPADAADTTQEEAAIVAELKAGSEAAYAWLIGEFQQPVYGLVYRVVNDPADAADTTQ